MSIKTCRVLQIIAFVLFAVTFLGIMLSIPLQRSIVSLYTTDPAILDHFDFPWAALARSVLYLLPALLYLIFVHRRMSPGGSRAVVIVFCIVMGVTLTVTGPLLDMLITSLAGKEGALAFTYYTSYNNAVSFISGFTIVPAEILMFLSMGGFYGKDTRS